MHIHIRLALVPLNARQFVGQMNGQNPWIRTISTSSGGRNPLEDHVDRTQSRPDAIRDDTELIGESWPCILRKRWSSYAFFHILSAVNGWNTAQSNGQEKWSSSENDGQDFLTPVIALTTASMGVSAPWLHTKLAERSSYGLVATLNPSHDKCLIVLSPPSPPPPPPPPPPPTHPG